VVGCEAGQVSRVHLSWVQEFFVLMTGACGVVPMVEVVPYNVGFVPNNIIAVH